MTLEQPLVDSERPWLGLSPYREEHHEFFFGRDREVEEIFGRIRDNPLTLLYGQSGLGKSSLLAAGVVPRLTKAGHKPVILRLSYDGSASRPCILAQVRDALSLNEHVQDSLWELFHRRDGDFPRLPILIFDQFEEIFTLGDQPQFESEVDDWLEQMSDLLQNRPPSHLLDRFGQDPDLGGRYHFGDAPVRIVFTLREDYLAHLERWKARLPLLMQNRMALSLLTGPQARQVVLGPAQIGEHSLVSRDVAESIVRTVARVPPDTPLEQIKAVPPLLSLLCEQLNQARLAVRSPQITSEMVTDQSENILQRFYEDSFLSFPKQHRSRIRALLEDPPMITEAGYRHALVREDAESQLRRADVPAPRQVFDALIQRRLITVETENRVQRLEITHDVLVPILLRSRKERQYRESKEKAEREAAITLKEQLRGQRAAKAAQKRAEDEASAAKLTQARLAKQRRNLWFLNVVITVLALLAIGFASYGLKQARKAEQANAKNLDTLHEASIADEAVAKRRIGADNKWHEGVAYLARSLKWEPENQSAANHLYSTLVLNAPEKQTWPRTILSHDYDVLTAEFSVDGTRIITAGKNNAAQLWDATTGMSLGESLRHAGAVITAHFSSDGSRILTASADHTVQVWDVVTGKPVGKQLTHRDEVSDAEFTGNGRLIVTASRDCTAQVWDASTSERIGVELRHTGAVVSARFNQEGSLVVTASRDKSAQVWDARTGQEVGPPMRHKDEVLDAEFSKDSSRVVTASWDKTALVWEIKTSKQLFSLPHTAGVVKATFSDDGTRIVTVAREQAAHVWDAFTGKHLLKLEHPNEVSCAEFSADGARIVTGGGKPYSKIGEARVWDALTGAPFGEFLQHEAEIASAKFSADGRFVITASWDNTARVWDAATGMPTRETKWEIDESGPFPVPVDSWILERAHAVAGLNFDTEGEMQVISPARRMATLTESVQGDGPWARLAHWLVEPANQRTLTPESKITRRQMAEMMRDRNTKKSLEVALLYDPGLPLAHLFLADILWQEKAEMIAANQSPLIIQSITERITFLRKHSLEILPEDDMLWARAARMLREKQDFALSLQAARKALSLNPKNGLANEIFQDVMKK